LAPTVFRHRPQELAGGIGGDFDLNKWENRFVEKREKGGVNLWGQVKRKKL